MKLIWKLYYPESLTYAEKILKILKAAGIPLPLNFLSRISGISKYRTCRVVNSLVKYEEVEKTTEQRAAFYSLKKARKKR